MFSNANPNTFEFPLWPLSSTAIIELRRNSKQASLLLDVGFASCVYKSQLI